MDYTKRENNRVEVWKDIRDYEDLYQGSNWGRVKSLERIDCIGHHRKERILKPVPDKDGYLRVGLRKNNKRKNFLVHRLIAQAFLDNPNNLPEVNHRDENPQNNFVSNLEWCSAKYNSNFGTRNKRIIAKNTNGKRSKKVYQYTLDGQFVREWESTSECGRNGFDQGHVAECCRGERKTHKDFIWKYK